MRVRRLGWAGVEVEADGAVAVIDLFEDIGPIAPFIGEPHGPLLPPSRPGEVALALVTHLHSDHADPPAIARALADDGTLLRPPRAEGGGLETAAVAPAEQALAELGLRERQVAPWESVQAGPFRATAVPSVDGFGDPQVGWAVEADGTRIVHYGDTVLHGSWWLTKMRLGPIDAAFLPVNGPLVDLPHRQPPSPFPAAMDGRQAAGAAAILEAGEAIAIHYDTLNNPPIYAQAEDPAGTFLTAAAELDVNARVLEPGEWLAL